MDHRIEFTPATSPTDPILPDGQSLIEQVRQVARRVRRLMIFRAAALVFVLCCVAWIVAATLDSLVRSESPWFRWSMTSIVVAAAVGGIVRWLSPVLRSRPSLVSTARRIERSLPQSNDRLSSTIDLLLDSRRESATDLRELAIAESTQALATMSLQKAVDPLPTKRLLLVAAAIALSFVVTTSLVPALRLATARMSVPFRQLTWPARDRLRLTVPEIVHQRTDLLISVSDDAPPLPRDLQLQVRSFGSAAIENIATERLTDESSSYQWKLPIEHELEVRAIGGDDQQMPWRTIRMVQSPSLKEHRVRIESPEYARQAPRELTGFRFEVLSGSRVELDMTFTQPLLEASLVDTHSDRQFPKFVSIISDDRLSVRFTLDSMSSSRDVRVSWLDEHSLKGQTPNVWHFDVTADQPPDVNWLSPSQDLAVSNRAVIDLQWQAKDDVGLVKIEIKSSELPLDRIPLPQVFQAESSPPQRMAVANAILSLTDIKTLHPGMTLHLNIIAIDNAGQTGHAERHIAIVNEAAIDQFATELLRQATAAVRQAITEQSLAASETLASRSMKLSELRGSINNAARSQDAASQQLHGGPQAAKGLLDKASQYLRQNQVSPKFAAQINDWSTRLHEITKNTMRASADQLARQAEILAESSPDEKTILPEIISTLTEVNKQQSTAIAELESILEEMSATDAGRQTAFELSEIDRQQRRLNEQTTAAKNRGEVTPGLAELQRRLSRRAAEISHKLNSLEDKAAKAAARQLNESGVATEMLEAASAIEQQKHEQAESLQQNITESLDAAAKALRGESALLRENLVQWREVVQSISRIRDGQRQVVDELSVGTVSELADRERQLADKAMTLSKQIEEQPAFSSALQDAGHDMQTASAGLARGRSEGFVRLAATDALKRLEAILSAAARADEHSPLKAPSQPKDSTASEPGSGPSLETIQLWRNLQSWLHQETTALDQKLSNDLQPPADMQQRRMRLAEEQLTLGRAIGKMSQAGQRDVQNSREEVIK